MRDRETNLKFDGPGHYLIRVKGKIYPEMKDWLGGLKVSWYAEEKNITYLSGEIADQAALIGVLTSLYDFRLSLLQVIYQGQKELTQGHGPTNGN